MTTQAETSKEFKTATRIAVAIQKKFPKHKEYVREITTGGFSFFEIALRPNNGSHNDEVTTAYSSQYFADIDETNIKERAGRILKDFKILMGLPLE